MKNEKNGSGKRTDVDAALTLTGQIVGAVEELKVVTHAERRESMDVSHLASGTSSAEKG